MKRFSAAIILLSVCMIAFAADTKSTEWPTYGHDSGGMRFSPLKLITPANVAKLQPAWVYHMKPADARLAASASTPLVVNGVMYASTPYGRVVALDRRREKKFGFIPCPVVNLRLAALNTGRVTHELRRKLCSEAATGICFQSM